MSGINGINYNTSNNSYNLYTKRTCVDNSETYITSKLNMLYEKTMLNKNLFDSKRSLKKMIEGNYLDELV